MRLAPWKKSLLRAGLATTSAWLVLSLAACATPEARIKRNQDIFNALPPAEQALIREGKVAIGFTPDMVRLAVGEPDQRWTRTDAQGEAEIWSYTSHETGAGVGVGVGMGVTHYRGDYRRRGDYPFYSADLYPRDARSKEYFKVVYTAGKVSAIEQATP